MRWSDEDAAVAVRSLLEQSRRGDEPAPPNFGVVVGETVDGVTAKHTLYRANRRVLRTASTGRIARGIVRGLGEHAMAPPGPASVDVEAVVVVHGDAATLVDRRLAWALDDRSVQIAKAGRRIVDTGVVRLDLNTPEVDLTLPGDWDDRWHGIDVEGDRADRVELREPAPRYPLAGVVVGGTVDPAVPPVVSTMSLFAGSDPVPMVTVERWIDVAGRIDAACAVNSDDVIAALIS